MNKLLYLFCLVSTVCFANERKTLIITGASGELGTATAKILAQEYDLILTGRNQSKLDHLQSELKEKHSGNFQTCTLDFTQPASIAHFKEFLAAQKTKFSGLALIGSRPSFYGKGIFQEEDKWLEVIQTTFTGPIEALKSVIPHLSSDSKIAIIAGTTSVQFQPDTGPSCVIRRMWTSYSKALSHELGPKGIRVNCLSPGIVLTNFHQERIDKKSQETGLSFEEQMKQEVAVIPMKRHAKPQEVAQSLRFLLSSDSDFINGVNLVLDGGFTGSY